MQWHWPGGHALIKKSCLWAGSGRGRSRWTWRGRPGVRGAAGL